VSDARRGAVAHDRPNLDAAALRRGIDLLSRGVLAPGRR
jgi:hypothetical protein